MSPQIHVTAMITAALVLCAAIPADAEESTTMVAPRCGAASADQIPPRLCPTAESATRAALQVAHTAVNNAFDEDASWTNTRRACGLFTAYLEILEVALQQSPEESGDADGEYVLLPAPATPTPTALTELRDFCVHLTDGGRARSTRLSGVFVDATGRRWSLDSLLEAALIATGGQTPAPPTPAPSVTPPPRPTPPAPAPAPASPPQVAETDPSPAPPTPTPAPDPPPQVAETAPLWAIEGEVFDPEGNVVAHPRPEED